MVIDNVGKDTQSLIDTIGSGHTEMPKSLDLVAQIAEPLSLLNQEAEESFKQLEDEKNT